MSPEIAHHVNINAVVCHGPTLDILLIKDLFNSVIQTSILFDIDSEFREEIQQTLKQLPPLQIGQLGQIQEWFEDWDEVADVHNRHMYIIDFKSYSKMFFLSIKLGLICIVFIQVIL